MVENVWRKVAFILALVAAAVVMILTFDLRLGLDLKGGTRLVYRVDFDAAQQRGDIQAGDDRAAVLTGMIGIISQRIDPQGVLDAAVQTQGSDRILIELPETDPLVVKSISDRIAQLGNLEMRMLVAADYNKEGVKFDLTKETERLRKWLEKKENQDAVLNDPANGIVSFNQNAGEEGEEHPASAFVRWYPAYATRKEVAAKPGDSADDVKKGPWVFHEQVPGEPAAFTATFQGDPNDPQTAPHFIAINTHEDHFTGKDLIPGAIKRTATDTGAPAVAYEITPARVGAYADLSGNNIGKKKAIILNGMVRSAPSFVSRISGSGQITLGGAEPEEVESLIMTLKTGSLRIRPELVTSQTLGAALGAQAIKNGITSLAIGSGAVILFMLAYYRLAGIVAVVCLFLNLLLLIGCMAGIHATLTLPGIAGLVLTMGMAVDTNILIYERIREERDRGKGLAQAVKAGFDRAFVAILDSNLTTFLCGVILYNVGTGPIRGFAVTLMIGIATSMFTGVFVSKVIMHLLVHHAKIEGLKMARLFSKVNIPWMSYRKPMIVLSALLMAGSLFAFFAVPPGVKYGLDFMGGAAIRASFREPLTQKQVVARLQGDESFAKEFATPFVTTTSGTDEQGRATEFSIKLKLTDEQRQRFSQQHRDRDASENESGPSGVLAYVVRELERILGDQLAYKAFDKVSVVPSATGTSKIVDFVVHFTEPVKTEELRTRIRLALTSPTIASLTGETQPTQAQSFKIDGIMGPDVTESDLPSKVQEALQGLKTVADNPVKLSNPFPEAEEIGPRAVGDLTNAAARAVLLALFLILIYVRVRFHEYKYGIGAVLSLLHDVLLTLGFVVAFHWLGIVDVEIDLALIAVFLTVIGYSVNDTIVIFDRVREDLAINKNLGVTRESFEDLLNRALNQTFSRTILTTSTVLVTVLCMFLLNVGTGSPLEGFAFPMLIGLISGTYSTVFIASAAVLWVHNRSERGGGGVVASVAAPTKVPSRADATV